MLNTVSLEPWRSFFSRSPAFHVRPVRATRKSPLLVGKWCGSSWGKSDKNLSLKSLELCLCAREECCRYQVRLPWLSFVWLNFTNDNLFFFSSLWADGIVQILQSDWFRERAVYLRSCPLTRAEFSIQYRPRSTASGGTQDLVYSFFQYEPPGRWIRYIYLAHRCNGALIHLA